MRPNRHFLTVKDAGALIGLAKSTAYDHTNIYDLTNGEDGLPFKRVGRNKWVPVEAFEKRYGIKISSDDFQATANAWDEKQRQSRTKVTAAASNPEENDDRTDGPHDADNSRDHDSRLKEERPQPDSAQVHRWLAATTEQGGDASEEPIQMRLLG